MGEKSFRNNDNSSIGKKDFLLSQKYKIRQNQYQNSILPKIRLNLVIAILIFINFISLEFDDFQQQKEINFDQEKYFQISGALSKGKLIFYQKIIKNVIFLKKVRAGSCSPTPTATSSQSWIGSTSFNCLVGDYTTLYSPSGGWSNGWSVQGTCSIQNSNCGTKISIVSSSSVQSVASTGSCTFKVKCKLKKGGDDCDVTSNTINLSFSTTPVCTCSSTQASLKSSAPTSRTGSTVNTCRLVMQSQFFTLGSGYSLQPPCSLTGCASQLKISTDSNAYVYSIASSTSCSFTMTCNFISGSTTCYKTTSSIAVSFSSSTSASCIVPQTVSSLTLYLNQASAGLTNVYKMNVNAFSYSTSYFAIGSTCTFLTSTSSASLTTFTTTTTTQTLNIDTSSAYSLNFFIQCSFTDIGVSSGLTFSAQTANFRITVCQYTTQSLTAISLYKGSSTSTSQYSFTTLFTVSDSSNCPTTIQSISSTTSSNSNVAVSISSNQLKIVVSTSNVISITQTYSLAFSFSNSQTGPIITGSQYIEVVINCGILTTYQLTGTPSNLLYYTSSEMTTFSSNIVSYMKILSPDDTYCTYTSCSIILVSGTPSSSYLSIVSNSVVACQQPYVTAPACQTQITAPTVAVQQYYRYSCTTATTSSITVESQQFQFKYYRCENDLDSTLYTITTPSSALVFSYNRFTTTKTTSNVFIKSTVPGCVNTASCTSKNLVNVVYSTTTLTTDSITSTTSLFEYGLKSVNVGTVATYDVVVSCQVKNNPSIVLTTSSFQIIVQLNCLDITTYQLAASPPTISLNYNQGNGLHNLSAYSFSLYFLYPDTTNTCLTYLQSCSIVITGSTNPFIQSLTPNYADNTFVLQVITNYGCGISDTYKLSCIFQQSGTSATILSNSFLMQLNRDCSNPSSFSISSSIADITFYQFTGTNSLGTFSTQKLMYFSQFFTALCPNPSTGCTYFNCQIWNGTSLSTSVTYIIVDSKTQFKLNIITSTAFSFTGLQLQCYLTSALSPSSLISSSSFNVKIPCSPMNNSISSLYPSIPGIYNVAVAIPIKVTLNYIVTLSQYSNVTDPSYCSNFYYKYSVINGTSQNTILVFDSTNGQFQIYNSQQFIYQIQFAIVVNGVTNNFPLVWINQTCQVNSTVVSKPQTYSQLQLFVVNPSQTPTFSFDNFLTSNPSCLIERNKYQISGLNVNNLILVNSSKVMLNNPALGMKYASYSFLITATAQGGAYLTIAANLTVVPDCTLEKIYLNPIFPDFSNDPNYNLYKVYNGLPLLYVNQSSKDVFQTDLTKRFYSLNDYYCKFINFKIKQVLGKNDKGVYAPLSSSNYSSYFSISNYGIFKIKSPLETNYTHYLIYVQAMNIGNIWGGDSQQHLIDSSIYPYINPLLVDNNAYFLWDPKIITINLLTVQKKTFQQILPPISKATNKIIFNNKNYPFVTYQLDKYLGLLFMIDLSEKTYYSENFTLFITLQNSNNGNYKGYKIPLELIGNQTGNNQGKNRVYNCSADIQSISNDGIMTILFNETMQNQFDISSINRSNTIITLIPALQRDLDTDFDPSSIEFDWYAVSLIDKKLIINLNFSNPQALSPLSVKDRINVQLNGSEIFFFGAQTKMQLGKSFWELNSKVPRQSNGSNSMQGQAQAGKTIMMIVLTLGLFLKMLGQKSDEYLLLMVRSLQLIMHLPLYQVIFPQVSIMFIQIVIGISQFDILANFWSWDDQDQISFDPNGSQQRFDQLASIGYDKNNALVSLSTVGFVVIIYWIRLIVFSIFKLFHILTNGFFGGEKLIKIIRGQLFFNMILEVTLEGYLEFGTNGYINLRAIKLNQPGEIIGFAMSCFCIFMDVVFLPAVLLWINLFKDKYDLRKKAFKEKWGVVYDGYKYSTKYLRLYTLFFVFRRMLFLLIGFGIQDYKKTGVQLIYNMFMNLLALLFVGSTQAQVTRIKNRIEMMNELYVVLAGVFLPSFTDLTTTMDLKTYYGQLFTYLVSSFLAANLYFIIKVFYSSLMLIATKANNYLKIKLKINLNFFETKQQSNNSNQSGQLQLDAKNKQNDIYKKVLQTYELKKLKQIQGQKDVQQMQEQDESQNILVELKQAKPKIKGLISKQKQVNEKLIKKSKIVNMTVINESKNESIQSLSQSFNQEQKNEKDEKEDQEIEDIQAYEFIQVYKQFSYMFDVPGQTQLPRDHKYKDLNEEVGPFVFNQSDTQQETLIKLKRLTSIAKINISFSQNPKVKKEFKQMQQKLKQIADQNIKSNTRPRI